MVTYGGPQAAISAVDEQLSDGMAARTSFVLQEHNDVLFLALCLNFLGGGGPKIQTAFLTRH